MLFDERGFSNLKTQKLKRLYGISAPFSLIPNPLSIKAVSPTLKRSRLLRRGFTILKKMRYTAISLRKICIIEQHTQKYIVVYDNKYCHILILMIKRHDTTRKKSTVAQNGA